LSNGLRSAGAKVDYLMGAGGMGAVATTASAKGFPYG
jgi:hypothetical protein